MFEKKDDFGWFKFCLQTCSEVKRRGEPLDLVLWQGEQWAVTEYGLEKRDGTYHVQAKDMWSFAMPLDASKSKTRQCVFVHWFKHLSSKSWCDEDDIDHALQAFMLLFDEKGNRTHIAPPSLMGEAEIEEYAAQCANDAYEAARRRALEGLVFYAP
jgi:hypothetical protein